MNSTMMASIALTDSRIPGVGRDPNKGPEVILDAKTGRVTPFSQLLKENESKGRSIKTLDKLINLLKLSASEQQDELEMMDLEELAELQKLITGLLEGRLTLSDSKKSAMLQEQLIQLGSKINLILTELTSAEKRKLSVKLDNGQPAEDKLHNNREMAVDRGEKVELKDQLLNNNGVSKEESVSGKRLFNEEAGQDQKSSNANRAAILREFLNNKERQSSDNITDKLKNMQQANGRDGRGITEQLETGLGKKASFDKDLKGDLTRFMDLNQAEKTEGKEQLTTAGSQSSGEQQSTLLNQTDRGISTGTETTGKQGGQQVKQADVINQITEQLKLFNRSKNELEMQLEPDSLGKVRIKLKVEAGEVTAKFIVDNLAVKSHLEQSMQGLRQSLIRQGMQVDQINIETNNYHNPDSQQEQGQQFHQQQNQGQQQRNYSFNQEQLADLSLEELEELLEDNFENLPDVDLSNLSPNQRAWFVINRYQRMDLLA